MKSRTTELGLSPQIVPIQRFIEHELDRIEGLELPVQDRPEVEPMLSALFRDTLREAWAS